MRPFRPRPIRRNRMAHYAPPAIGCTRSTPSRTGAWTAVPARPASSIAVACLPTAITRCASATSPASCRRCVRAGFSPRGTRRRSMATICEPNPARTERKKRARSGPSTLLATLRPGPAPVSKSYARTCCCPLVMTCTHNQRAPRRRSWTAHSPERLQVDALVFDREVGAPAPRGPHPNSAAA